MCGQDGCGGVAREIWDVGWVCWWCNMNFGSDGVLRIWNNWLDEFD